MPVSEESRWSVYRCSKILKVFYNFSEGFKFLKIKKVKLKRIFANHVTVANISIFLKEKNQG